METIAAGLEGVIAGESEICYIDGYQGILSYRGYNIHTLADNACFEEVILLLWNGHLPRQDELDEFRKDLAANRSIPAPVQPTRPPLSLSSDLWMAFIVFSVKSLGMRRP